MRTYHVEADGSAITCLLCGMTSGHPSDVQERYCGHCHYFHAAAEGNTTVIWTVYRLPADFPNDYVVRAHVATRDGHRPTQIHHVAATLEEVRRHIPAGAYCIGRAPGDDPAIVESWL